MSSAVAPAGPSGVASPPPAWLAARPLPLLTILAGTPLFRVHQALHRPIFFGAATGIRQPPTNRFDRLAGAFGVLYLGRRSPPSSAGLVSELGGLSYPEGRIYVDPEDAVQSRSRYLI